MRALRVFRRGPRETGVNLVEQAQAPKISSGAQICYQRIARFFVADLNTKSYTNQTLSI